MTRTTLALAALLATTTPWAALHPLHVGLIPEAPRVLDHRESVYGERTLLCV